MISVQQELRESGSFAYRDFLRVLNDGRPGRFEGQIDITEFFGDSWHQQNRQYPLAWYGGGNKRQIDRGATVEIVLAEYYAPLIQEPANWMVGLIGWDETMLKPAYYANDPTARFELRVRVWRSSWLSDIIGFTVLDETVVIESPLRFKERAPLLCHR